MKGEFIRSNIRFLRTLQVIGGITMVLLGVAMFLRIFIPDAALDPNIKLSDYIALALLLVGPGVVVLAGSYVQLRHGKLWALVLLLLGGICGLVFVGLNMGFTFLYIRDRWGQFEVGADLVVILITLVTAIINATVPVQFDSKSR